MKYSLIYELPFAIDNSSLEDCDFSNNLRIDRNNLVIYESKKFPKNDYRGLIPLLFGISLVSILLINLLQSHNSLDSRQMLLFFSLIYLPTIITGVVLLFIDYKKSGIQYSFCRKQDLFIRIERGKKYEYPFNEIKAYLYKRKGYGGYGLAISSKEKSSDENWTLALNLPIPGLYLWSIIVWYMDNLRDYPPGVLFDNIRTDEK